MPLCQPVDTDPMAGHNTDRLATGADMTNRDLEPLSSRLAALREQTGLSLKQLGQQLHVSDSSLSRYFTAQAFPPWDVVEALAMMAGADPRTLRAEWEATRRARQQARYSGTVRPATVLPAPPWQPVRPAASPAPAPSAGRITALAASVVLLMAVSAGTAYALSGRHHRRRGRRPAIGPGDARRADR